MTKITKNINTLNQNTINLNFKQFNKKYFKHLNDNLLHSEIIADSGWQAISTDSIGTGSAKSNNYNYLIGTYDFIFRFPGDLISESELKNLNILTIGKKTGSVTPISGGKQETYDYGEDIVGYDIYNDDTLVYDAKEAVYTYPGHACHISGLYGDETSVNIDINEISMILDSGVYDTYLHEPYLHRHDTYNWITYKEYLTIRNFTSVSFSGDNFIATGTGVRVRIDITLNHDTLEFEYAYTYNIETVSIEVPLNYVGVIPNAHGGIGTVQPSLTDTGFFDSQTLFPIIDVSTLPIPLSDISNLYYDETEVPDNEHWVILIPNPPFDSIHDVYNVSYFNPAPFGSDVENFASENGPTFPDITTEEVVIVEGEIYLLSSSIRIGEQSVVYVKKPSKNNLYELRVSGIIYFSTNLMAIFEVDEHIYYKAVPQDVEVKCLINYTPQESNSKEYYD